MSDLNQHFKVEFFQEIFSSSPRKPVFYTKSREEIPHFINYTAQNSSESENIASYLAHINQKISPDVEWIGFKLLLNQLDERGDSKLLDYILENKIPIIFLDRDPFAASMSAAIAKGRNIYNVKTKNLDSQSVRSKMSIKPRISFRYLLSEMKMFEHWSKYWKNFLEESDHPHLCIDYEDYCSSRDSLIQSIFNFLELKQSINLGSNEYSKMSSDNKLNDISNKHQIRFKFFIYSLFKKYLNF